MCLLALSSRHVLCFEVLAEVLHTLILCLGLALLLGAINLLHLTLGVIFLLLSILWLHSTCSFILDVAEQFLRRQVLDFFMRQFGTVLPFLFVWLFALICLRARLNLVIGIVAALPSCV